MHLKSLLTALLAAVTLAWPAAAQDCVGQNLFDTMPPDRLAQLRAATDAVPHHQGLFWRADKDDAHVLLLGTYHFADPRHDRAMARFGPEIDRAAALLVEAGPEEEAKLAQAMAADSTLVVDPTGPTLPERLGAEDWQALSAALEDRGLPALIASKLRPWYVAVMLGISPCMKRMVEAHGDAGGLDHLLIARAQAARVPIRALEPWDTVFALFNDMTPKEEEDMIRAAMPAAAYADDYATTLSDAYFAGDSWMIWEFGRFDAYENSGLSRAEVDRQMRLAQEKLMDQRNESWIEPIEKAARDAARQGKGVVAGFGALHLPGRHGVLQLLADRGWTLSPVTIGGPAMADDLWREEREFWLSGAAEAARKLDDACLMAFAPAGILTRRRAVEALGAAPRWQEVTMADRASIETDEICVLAYHATARRAGAETYRALCTTTWIRRGGDWRIVQHQQTPVPA